MSTGHHHAPYSADEPRRGEPPSGADRRALWIAVGVTMAAIVACWAALLPGQMRGFSEFTRAQSDRFRAVSESIDKEPFRAARDEARIRLEALTEAIVAQEAAQAEEEAQQAAAETEAALDAVAERMTTPTEATTEPQQ